MEEIVASSYHSMVILTEENLEMYWTEIHWGILGILRKENSEIVIANHSNDLKMP